MAESENPGTPLDEIGHPKGTLAILAIYMLLFVLGWVGLYFYTFLPRGTPDADARGEAAYAPAQPEAPGTAATSAEAASDAGAPGEEETP